MITYCTVVSCDRPQLAKGMCGLHYKRKKKGQDLTAPPKKDREPKTCSIEQCGRPHVAKGFCGPHLKRHQRGVAPLVHIKSRNKPSSPTCSVDDCNASHHASGMCVLHYRRAFKFIDMNRPIKIRLVGAVCEVHGCERRAISKMMCDIHYNRSRLGIDLTKRIRGDAATISDIRMKGKDGYVLVAVPHGTAGAHASRRTCFSTMLEHRHVMQTWLGRPLLATETVHHRNGIRGITV